MDYNVKGWRKLNKWTKQQQQPTAQANNNEFGDWENVKELAECKKLITVYLENNPVQTEHRQVYRRRLQAIMPKLKQIDGMYTRSGTLGEGTAVWERRSRRKRRKKA